MEIDVECKPKLRTYRTIKTKLELEPYLLSEKNKVGRYLLTGLRSGTNRRDRAVQETKGSRGGESFA